jgi:hypothetical protein
LSTHAVVLASSLLAVLLALALVREFRLRRALAETDSPDFHALEEHT